MSNEGKLRIVQMIISEIARKLYLRQQGFLCFYFTWLKCGLVLHVYGFGTLEKYKIVCLLYSFGIYCPSSDQILVDWLTLILDYGICNMKIGWILNVWLMPLFVVICGAKIGFLLACAKINMSCATYVRLMFWLGY